MTCPLKKLWLQTYTREWCIDRLRVELAKLVNKSTRSHTREYSQTNTPVLANEIASTHNHSHRHR